MSVTLVNSHVLLPDAPNWRERPAWSRAWQTEVAEAVTGAEDRGALRQIPRVSLSYLLTPLHLQQQQRLESRLQAALKSGLAAVPYWGRGSELSAAASGTSASLSAPYFPFAIGDYVLFLDLSDPLNPVFESKQLTGAGATLGWSGALSHTYPAGCFVYLLLFGPVTAQDISPVTNHRGDLKINFKERTGWFRSQSTSFTTYLTRPVLETQINWAASLSRAVQYDLRELMLGFGAEQFAPLQSHVVHGFMVSLDLNTEADIVAHDDFTAALKGRLTGFWLPSPQAAFAIAAGEDATHFDITDQDLTNTLADHPARYVRFTKDGQTAQHAKVTAVTDNGDGTERVTVDASITVDATWEAHWLHYVRLATDEESAGCLGEGRQKRAVKMLELPTEYAAFETGESPVYLYHFWMNTSPVVHWRYTSFGADLVSGGNTFTSKAITHGEIRRGGDASAETVTIEAFYETGHPLALGLPYPTAKPINVEILEAAYATPSTTTTLFSGRIEKPPRKGKKITATALSVLDFDGKRILDGLIGSRCAYQLYEPNTCGVSQAAHQITGCTIDTITGRVIRVSKTGLGAWAANHFSFGWIETGSGAGFELRTILQDTVVSGTVRELTLNLPLVNAIAGGTLTVVPGCDGKWDTCQTKFSNTNALLHPFVPEKNPTLTAIPITVSQGGKK